MIFPNLAAEGRRGPKMSLEMVPFGSARPREVGKCLSLLVSCPKVFDSMICSSGDSIGVK